jgi:hypothetical protein
MGSKCNRLSDEEYNMNSSAAHVDSRHRPSIKTLGFGEGQGVEVMRAGSALRAQGPRATLRECVRACVHE